MKIRNIVFAFAIVLCFLGKAKAQDYTNYNLYLQNPVLYNPASALDESKLRAYVNSHLQWMGFDGAPVVNSFGVFGNFVQNMGFGLTAYNKQQGLTTRTNISLDYAYRANIGEKHYITFGVAGGILMNKLNSGSVVNSDMTDQVISMNSFNKNVFAAQAGIVYYYRSFEAHLVLPQLLGEEKNNGYVVGLFTYDYALNPLWDIKPAVMFRTNNTTPSQYEGSVMLTYKKLVSGQVGYRTDKSFILGLGLNWGPFTLGYAWQEQNNYMSSVASKGTNEFQLIYRFGQSKNIVPKDNSLVSLSDQNKKDDEKKAQNLDSLQREEIKKLDDLKKQTDDKIDQLKKLEDENLQEQKKIEDQLNNMLKKIDDLDKRTPQLDQSAGFNSQGQANFSYVLFETGTSTLTPQGTAVLDKFVETLKQNPTQKVDISGHTDNTGSESGNLVLSKNRANACKKYLESKGISADRLKASGYGSANPAAPNTSWENKAKNRRTEFKLIK